MNERGEVVVVTGGSGLIGSRLIRQLTDRYRIVTFDRTPPTEPPSGVTSYRVDLASDESVRQGLAAVADEHGRRIASVIHLAAYYDFSGEPSPLYEQVTIGGTRRLLNGLREFEVGQIAFSSTALLHAPCEPGERIDEDWPIEPTWPYPESKVRTELLLRESRGAIPVVLLRIAGGYDETCHSIPLAHQIQRIYERRITAYLYPGDLLRGQPFVHLDDVVDAIVRTVDRRENLPEEVAILIGEPETLSYDELQRRLGKLIHGEELETRPIPKELAKAGAWVQDAVPFIDPFIKPWMIDRTDDHQQLDIARARRLLGWTPTHSLRETLPAMVASLKRDPEGWYRENGLEPPSDGATESDAAGDAGGE